MRFNNHTQYAWVFPLLVDLTACGDKEESEEETNTVEETDTGEEGTESVEDTAEDTDTGEELEELSVVNPVGESTTIDYTTGKQIVVDNVTMHMDEVNTASQFLADSEALKNLFGLFSGDDDEDDEICQDSSGNQVSIYSDWECESSGLCTNPNKSDQSCTPQTETDNVRTPNQAIKLR